MAQAAPVMPPPPPELRGGGNGVEPELRFELILLNGHARHTAGRAATLTMSVAAHSLLIALTILVPILTYDVLPAPSESVRAFFVAPLDAAPPPPPPPPPPARARALAQVLAAPAPPPEDASFFAPVEVPDTVRPELGLDLGLQGGVPGGVEGGVPGGVLGGIVGGLPGPGEGEPPPARVRVGGQVKAPQVIHLVPPIYPDLAAQARITAVVIVEAIVGTSGRVIEVKVLRGAPLFDEAAIEAVKQWRYRPLLLNGIPTEFILTATLKFNLDQPK